MTQKAIDQIPYEYRVDVQKAVSILKDQGCTKVYVYGSLLEEEVEENAHIDLAVTGLEKDQYFQLLESLMKTLDNPVDLVNLDEKDDYCEHLLNQDMLYID